MVLLVVREGGLVQDWGLFPASDVGAWVKVQCSSSPSGYGLQGLTWSELGGLWDLPISVMDAMPQGVAKTMLRAFCKTAPNKVLIAGADYLLTMLFRGGSKGVLGQAVSDLGPQPRDNLDIGLRVSSSSSPASSQMLEVIKGDSQKLDNPVVPDHLWLLAFAVGYGYQACLTQHREALGCPMASPGSLEVTSPPAGWQTAMLGFCLFALRYWKRGEVWGYARWRRANVLV